MADPWKEWLGKHLLDLGYGGRGWDILIFVALSGAGLGALLGGLFGGMGIGIAVGFLCGSGLNIALVVWALRRRRVSSLPPTHRSSPPRDE
ncbi:hypothetical protein GCM10009872_54290 [Actinopolymorpha rutila]